MKKLTFLLLLPFTLLAQVPNPADVFGFEPGADYKLADYTQLQDYYQQLGVTIHKVEQTYPHDAVCAACTCQNK